jgi:aspartyl-tRNA(Asn)/glutamyl-tRNA(Gln) amidotransferase subunit A
VLRRIGAEVVPIRLSSLQRYSECGRTLLNAESYAVHERDLKERPQDYAEISRRKLLPGAFIPAVDYIRAQQLRTVLCGEFADAMRGLDAVITASSLDMPCRIDDAETIAKTYERQCRLPFNVTGTPAISVPTGFTADGMPTAMQIAGRWFEDGMVYRVAKAYCDATGWCERRPLMKAPQRAASLVG